MDWLSLYFFFFQAEDGIRDHCVTGVQTCALPICRRNCPAARLCRRAHPYRRERSEEHTSELQSHSDLVCRLLLEKKKKQTYPPSRSKKKNWQRSSTQLRNRT